MARITNDQKKYLIDELSTTTTVQETKFVIEKYKSYELTPQPLGIIFEKLYIKNGGFSKEVTMEELIDIHPSFYTSNGGDWCRSNSGYLGKRYNIKRTRSKGRIATIKADGENKRSTISNSIRKDILDEISKKRCSILDIGTNIECDHKDGMKDDWRLDDPNKQTLDDFQALCKTANDSKRQHCKKCKETGIRYDAKQLGYSESYIYGSADSQVCTGCYWYDPQEFNRVISESFVKEV